MRLLMIGVAALLGLVLSSGGSRASELVPGAPNWNDEAVAPSAGSTQTYIYGSGTTTTTVTTTTTTLYPPSVPFTGYTPYGTADHALPDEGRSGSSPRASQIPTGTLCPPGTPDCGGANH